MLATGQKKIFGSYSPDGKQSRTDEQNLRFNLNGQINSFTNFATNLSAIAFKNLLRIYNE